MHQNFALRIQDSPERKHSVFKGAASLAQVMQNRAEFWVSRNEWYELGPQRALEKLGGPHL